jgi:alcohol dehydrogenase (cytochrome c)
MRAMIVIVIFLAVTVVLAGQEISSTGLTIQDLRNGLKDPSRWVMYSGDYTSRRHSPLTQITPANVNRLIAQWTFQTDLSAFMSTGRPGGLQSVPLVIDGVLYFAGIHNNVFAIDARTGRQIWRYQHDMPADVPGLTTRGVTRGLAVLGNRLFLGTLDAHIIALDIKSGRLVWDTTIEDYKKFFSITSAPLVISNNKVITGIGGGDRSPSRFFIDAYDTETGKRVWRFYTIPAAGEPGSETWGTSQSVIRAGGATWTMGSYDPELNVVYWGTGNPYGASEARPGDNLYSSSIVALDGDTGKLRWHYQIVPHDIHDYDADSIPILADIRIAGQQRKTLLFAPKTGYLYVLDRTDGKFLAAYPVADFATNWAKEFAADGRPVLLPEDGTRCLPDINGAANYWPSSYDSALGLFFVTVHNTCQVFNPGTQGGIPGVPGSFSVGGPGYAALRGYDPATGKQKMGVPISSVDLRFNRCKPSADRTRDRACGRYNEYRLRPALYGRQRGEFHRVRFPYRQTALALSDWLSGVGIRASHVYARWTTTRADCVRPDIDRLRFAVIRCQTSLSPISVVAFVNGNWGQRRLTPNYQRRIEAC